MDSNLWSISCDPSCGFAVQGHDKDEVINLCYEHVSQSHPDMNLNREQLTSMVSNSGFCSK